MNAIIPALTGYGARLGLSVLGAAGPARLSILIFHRVLARPDTIFEDEPDAPRFDALMGVVARAFRVMTLGEAAAHLAADSLPSRSLVITFDDGYADNAEIALPILRKHGLKASFFVSTGFLDGGRMWNDSIIECVRASTLEQLDLGEFGLGRMPASTAAERRALLGQLLPRIKYMTLAERERAIEKLMRVAKVAALPDDLMMRSEQVRELHAAGMEIGGHTINHPILTTLSAVDAEREIAGGRERLQQLIAAPIEVFAYPNGKPGRDYDGSHVALLKRLGFKAAVSTAPGAATAGADPFQLPRYTPWGRSLPVWAARLAANLRGAGYEQTAPAGRVY